MGRMYFRYGAMGASKTAQALITQYNYQERGLNVLMIKPAMDTRDGATVLKSRIGLQAEVIAVTPEEDIFALFVRGETTPEGYRKYDVVIADESQFLAPAQVEQLRRIVDIYDVPVFCYGLRTDFQTKLFEGSKRIIELTDEIEEIKTVCSCGRKAVVNARLLNGRPVYEGDQVMLGGNESYIAMCHKCWDKARAASKVHTQVSEKMKKRFVKDMNLPIKELEDAEFYAMLDHYDEQFGCRSAFDVFVKSAESYESDEAYLDAYDDVLDRAVEYIKNNPAMHDFVDIMKNNDAQSPYKVGTKDIYRPHHANKFFVSFDMKKANFSALKQFNPAIVGDKATYEEFVGMFTDNPHIIHSKKFRAKVFGNTNPKQITRYENMLMDRVTTELLNHFTAEQLVFKSADEVVVEITEDAIAASIEAGKAIVKSMTEQNIPIRCEIFQLLHLPGKGMLKKAFYGEKPYVPKTVSAEDMFEVISIIKSLPTNHWISE